MRIPGRQAYLKQARDAEKARGRLARQLAPRLGIEESEAAGAISSLHFDYLTRLVVVDTETAAEAEVGLGHIAESAAALAAALKNMGAGANTLLFKQAWQQGSPASHPAELRHLPDVDPFATPMDADHWPKGLWVIRLEALAKLARDAGRDLTKLKHRGKKLGSTLHGGTPERWLAAACRDFVLRHDCGDPDVARVLWRAVWECEHGARPGPQAGRKDIAAVFQNTNLS